MTNPISVCPIWGEGYPAEGICFRSDNLLRVDDSPRTAGGYGIGASTVTALVENMTDAEKAKLTTWLVDQRLQGNTQPRITEDAINRAKRQNPLPVHERADRLLRFIAGQSKPVGTGVESNGSNHFKSLAWSESVSNSEVRYLMNYLKERNWLMGVVRDDGSFIVEVTVDGFGHIAEQATNVDLTQVFVAMWFDQSMDKAYWQGIEQAISKAGYKALRIDQKPHNNKIDDEIIAEIRRSKFLVADFTQGDDGARGGVYYEAGFAHGLGLKVIFTCHKDAIDKVHFDTNHYNHVVWATTTELLKGVKDRILAEFGQGPLPPNQ